MHQSSHASLVATSFVPPPVNSLQQQDNTEHIPHLTAHWNQQVCRVRVNPRRDRGITLNADLSAYGRSKENPWLYRDRRPGLIFCRRPLSSRENTVIVHAVDSVVVSSSYPTTGPITALWAASVFCVEINPDCIYRVSWSKWTWDTVS
ncbi:unnamed protein product [Sphagnum balticum]